MVDARDIGRPIQVAAACDASYAMPLAVMLASLAARLGRRHRVVAHVLESGLDAATRARVAQSVPGDRLSLRWTSIDASRFAGLRATLRDFDTVSLASYYRLLLPEVIPADVDRLIYLDSDLVVLHDLWDLWTTEIGDACLGAVPELLESARYASSRAGIRLHRQLGLRADMELFNSGVLLINLARWRNMEVAARALNYLREAALHLRWHDQEALNAVVAGDWTPLDPRWNVTMHVFRSGTAGPLRELARKPRIVHYNAAIKPWHADFQLGYGELFYRYLDTTAWRDWRPQQARHATLRRLAARLLRSSLKARHAIGRQLQVVRRSLRGWSARRQAPQQIAGPPVPDTAHGELRVFMAAEPGRSYPADTVAYYLSHGVDRLLLAGDRRVVPGPNQDDPSSRQRHVFLRPETDESGHETIRRLLHRYGNGHWCIVVDSDELLLGMPAAEMLTTLRDYLELGGYDALECRVRKGDDVPDAESRLRRLPMTASDPLSGRIFTVSVHAAASGARTAELDCRSKVAMLRYRDDLVIDREFRGVLGARLADVGGVILRASRGSSGDRPAGWRARRS